MPDDEQRHCQVVGGRMSDNMSVQDFGLSWSTMQTAPVASWAIYLPSDAQPKEGKQSKPWAEQDMANLLWLAGTGVGHDFWCLGAESGPFCASAGRKKDNVFIMTDSMTHRLVIKISAVIASIIMDDSPCAGSIHGCNVPKHSWHGHLKNFLLIILPLFTDRTDYSGNHAVKMERRLQQRSGEATLLLALRSIFRRSS